MAQNAIDLYRQQINHDAQQINYITEGGTYVINLTKDDIPGNNPVIGDTSTAFMQVPIDTLIEAISFVAFIDNPDNPGVGDCIPTTAVKITFRDTLTKESRIFTAGGEDFGEGTPVPANLLFGPKPTQLAAPFPLYQNTTLEFTVQPAGFEILDFVVSFWGRRMDMMPQWERDQVCGDPRTQGAYWIYFDPQVLTRADSDVNPCGRGPVEYNNLRIPNQPFDILVTAWSGFVSPGIPADASPIARAWYEFKLIDLNNKKFLSEGFIPSFSLGGSTFNSSVIVPAAADPLDLEQVLEYVPRSTPLNNAWVIRSQTAIQAQMRSAFSPLDPDLFPTITTQLMLQGMKIPSSEIAIGFPYYNRNDGSLRCPPGSDGIPPGYPVGGASPYVDMNGPAQGFHPQQQGQPQYAINGLGNQPGQPGMPPLVERPARGVYVNNMVPPPAPGTPWPASMPYPPPALNSHEPVMIRNPDQQGGKALLPNRGPYAQGWGIPGNPQDGRGPRFRNTNPGGPRPR